MSLKDYKRKRNFDKTPEPEGTATVHKSGLRFVIHKHAATRLHFDLRLEMDGVFKSWAIPKGPSLNPSETRLAVFVEDHPIEYGSFEGIIPAGNYGAGTVMIWDAGTYTERFRPEDEATESVLLQGLEKGHITFILKGRKLGGEFALIRLKEGQKKEWILIKKRDQFASIKEVVSKDCKSIATGRTMNEISSLSEAEQSIWTPGNGPQNDRKLPVDLYEPGEHEKKANKKVHKLPLPSLVKSQDHSKSELLPRRLKPMLPIKYGTEPFDHSDWLFEPFFKGYKTIATCSQDQVDLLSKQLLSFNSKFPEVRKYLRSLKLQAVLDGEILVYNQKGHPDPLLLRNYTRDKKGSVIFLVTDILHLDGENLQIGRAHV